VLHIAALLFDEKTPKTVPTQTQKTDENALQDVFCELKWFNTAKGYGFVRTNGLTADIFLHASLLQCDNHPLVGEGATMKCDIRKTDNGYSVEKVLTVIETGDTPFQKAEDETQQLIITTKGIVKRYSTTSEFGFIIPDDGVKDIFVHKSCVENSGLEELIPGQSVEVSYKTVPKGREALSVKVLQNP
tara:strand:+ start:101228 stop:101791 length:564 start_codon:yes stop_codon:yes gene_type:complete